MQGLLTALLVLTHASAVFAETPDPIRHTLRISSPHTHYIEVETVVPAGDSPRLELMMAVWTPGSYLVREYARNIETLTARTADGAALHVEQSRKNRWRIESEGSDTVVVTYRLYCREMSVRTNWVDDEFALINGAPTFLTLVDDLVAKPDEPPPNARRRTS